MVIKDLFSKPKYKLPILLFIFIIFYVFILFYKEYTANSNKINFNNFETNIEIKYDITHLNQEKNAKWGPIQNDEGLFVYSIIKMIRPKIVVEIGMLYGFSTINILKALDSDSKLYTYDKILQNPDSLAFNDKRFKFVNKSMTDFDSNDIDNEKIDLIHLDNGHVFENNVKYWKKSLSSMKENCIIIVHDTGLHLERSLISNGKIVCDVPNFCGKAHNPDERNFINWIIENHPEMEIINFHSINVLRHGMTLISRKYKLKY